jgi:predicted extracellular nuclease
MQTTLRYFACLIGCAAALWGCDPRGDANRGIVPPPLPMQDAEPPPPDQMLVDQGVRDAAIPLDVMGFDPPDEVVIATYNLHNLFDTQDDPRVDEGEYTPGGRWNSERLRQRVDELARVFQVLDADIVSVTEVESEAALDALAAAILRVGGPDYAYRAISATRDGRGIRIGALSRFPIVRSGGRPINIEHSCEGEDGPVTLDNGRPESRPIFQVEIDLSSDGISDLVLFGNHWKAKTNSSWPCDDDEHRIRSARQLREVIDTFIAEDPDRPVIGIGDLNAFEFEAPVRQALGAQLDASMVQAPGGLYNIWGDAGVTFADGNRRNNATNASYNFRGEWTRLDHILLTGNMHPDRGSADWRWVPGTGGNLHENFMFNNQGRPRQWSFSDGRGFSDHLPVQITLQRAD